MKTNITLVKKLARLNVLDTEPIKYKKDSDIIIENNSGENVKVVTDNISDEDLPLMLATEQLATLKSIRNMVKYFFITALVGVGAWLLMFLIDLGNKL